MNITTGSERMDKERDAKDLKYKTEATVQIRDKVKPLVYTTVLFGKCSTYELVSSQYKSKTICGI